MSLRTALQTAVARCAPLETQHATFTGNSATCTATATQQTPANPHEIRVSYATAGATPTQQGAATGATRADSGEKLRVAFASTRNTQLGSLTAHRVTADLLKAAMRACDHYGDGPAARELMRADCLATPAHLQQDLLDHFNQTLKVKQ